MNGKVGDPVQRCPKQKKWIKFKFIDDESDEVISNVIVSVKLPDGIEKEYTSNNLGIIDIKDINPGSCKLSSDWKGYSLSNCLDFVSINGQSKGKKENTQTSSSTEKNQEESKSTEDKEESLPYRIADIKEYKVKTGDTLKKLSADSGISWRELSLFNWATDNPDQVNWFLREFVGCRKRTKDKRNYIFTNDDDPGIVFIPQLWSKDGLNTERTHELRLRRQYYFSPVEVQTVDEFGVRYGNVTIVLKSLNGWPDVEIGTDVKGYGKKKQVLCGKYKVYVKDKGPAYFLKDLNRNIIDPETKKVEYGKYNEAIFNTKDRDKVILRLVVKRDASQEEKKTRVLIKHIYSRTGKKVTIEGRGEETKGQTRQSFHWCADNLVLAAGWHNDYKEVNIKALVSDTLKSYLNDYFPIDIKRGYYVFVIEQELKKVTLVNKNGKIEKTFKLTQELKGLVGAYASFPDIDKILFRDIVSTTYALFDPADSSRFIPLEEIIFPQEVEDFVESMNKHVNEVMVIYFAPSAQQLAVIALHGGTGSLEDYGGDNNVKKSIHKRNLVVCNHIRDIYNIYVRQYVGKVKETASEGEIRKLGPPKSSYQMPSPAGSTQTQLIDIFEALSTNELDAWIAIAHQLDDIYGRKSQGYPFLRIKVKYKKAPKLPDKFKNLLKKVVPETISDPLETEVEIETNIDIVPREDKIKVLKKGDVLIKIKAKGNAKPRIVLTKEGYPVEVGFKQSLGNPEKQVVTINFADFFKIERDTIGKTKLSIQAAPGIFADSEMNYRTGTFGGGVTITGKALASKLKTKYPESSVAQKVASWLESFEFQLLVGFVGTREETILAIVSHAPGFFERREINELFSPSTMWADLTLDEESNLVKLGWYEKAWNMKFTKTCEKLHPESVKKSREQLTAVEKIAIVHLGFYEYEEYGKIFKKKILEFADYSY